MRLRERPAVDKEGCSIDGHRTGKRLQHRGVNESIRIEVERQAGRENMRGCITKLQRRTLRGSAELKIFRRAHDIPRAGKIAREISSQEHAQSARIAECEHHAGIDRGKPYIFRHVPRCPHSSLSAKAAERVQ